MREVRTHRSDTIHGLPYWRIYLQDYIVDKALGLVHASSSGIRILDLGCGLGYTLTRLSRLLPSGSLVFGIDIEPRNIKKASAMVEELGDSSKVKVYCADAERTSFGDGYFDIVVANLSFSVFKNARMAASEVVRILKPGGRVILSEVSDNSFLGKMGILLDALTHHLYYTLYSPKVLARLFIPLGLRVESISRIPLAIKIRKRRLRIPSAISPAFHVELSKPHRLYQNGRVN